MANAAALLVVTDDEAFSDAVASAVDAERVRTVSPAGLDAASVDADCVVCDGTLGDPDAVAARLRDGDVHRPVLAVGDETVGRAAAAADVRWVPESSVDEVLPERVEGAVERYREVRSARETERWFAALTDDSPCATVVLDSKEIVQYASPAVSELLGYDPEDLVGESAERIIPEAFQERHERAMERFAESGSRHLDWTGVSLVARHASGEDVPVDVSLGTTVRDGERYFGAVFRPEDAPAEESARFRKHEAFSTSVFENTSDVILVADPDTDAVIDANPAASDTLGYDYRTLCDASLRGLFVEGDLPDPSAAERAPVTARTADGEERVLEVSAATLSFEGESAVLYSGRDVTERRRRETELERQNERLEEFASIVSHDLRNPLNLATANADLVREGHPERIEMVEEALDDMEALIDDLLSLARQGRVVSAEEFETFPLEAVARDAWGKVSPPETAELRVEAEIELEGDRDRTTQALVNLFRNSVEHGSTGGRERPDNSVEHGSTSNRTGSGDSVEHGSTGSRPKADDAIEHGGESVTVTVGETDGGFYVADDGPGIPADERADVLEAGYTTAERGTGYGLAIVSRIAAAHGWEVSVSESETGGARFDVVL